MAHQGLIKEKVMYKEQLLRRFSKTLSMVLKQFFEPLENDQNFEL